MPFQPGNQEGKKAQKVKPFRDALMLEEKELAAGTILEHPPGSLRWNAQRLLMEGAPNSIREIGDRLDGKPAQAHIGGDEDDPALNVHHTITRRILGPGDTNSSGSPAAA